TIKGSPICSLCEVSTPSCIDSDGGKDYYTKGYVTHVDGTKEYDYCDNNLGYEGWIVEYYCTSIGHGMTDYECPYGCSNGACNPQPAKEDCIEVINFHYDASGNDNYNLNDEYVTFKNKCSYSIDMTDWTVKDEHSYHTYRFPSFTLQQNSMFTLYTGIGTDTNTKLYWGRSSGSYAAVWNNGGDTLYLRDSEGNLILIESY
ncbi:unnamed protein product, partial [marine sediment metagenome]